jgi:hypothetical protein
MGPRSPHGQGFRARGHCGPKVSAVSQNRLNCHLRASACSRRLGRMGARAQFFLRCLCDRRPSVRTLVRDRETRAQWGVAFLNTSGRSNSISFGGEASKIAKIGSSAHATFVASLYKSIAFLNTLERRPLHKPRRHGGHGGRRESWGPQLFCVSAFLAISASPSRNFQRLRAAHCLSEPRPSGSGLRTAS